MSWNVGQVVNLSVDADEDDTRLDRWLKRKFHGLTQGQIEKACRTGEIRVDGARAKANTRVKAGQTVRIPPMTAPKGKEADEDEKPRVRVKSSDADLMRSLVIFEDDRIIALNKPPGIATQGGTGTTRHIDGLSRALVDDTAEKPRLVHRLDRDTSGLILVALDPVVHRGLSVQFADRQVHKRYLAVVHGRPQAMQGRIELALARRQRQPPLYGPDPAGKPCRTDWRLLGPVSDLPPLHSRLELWPLTGRSHQLRVHLSVPRPSDPGRPPVRPCPQQGPGAAAAAARLRPGLRASGGRRADRTALAAALGLTQPSG